MDTLLTGAAGLLRSHTHTRKPNLHTPNTDTYTHTARSRQTMREKLMLKALKINGERRITREARRVNF